MKNITTSLYAVAHITNELFTGPLTDGKEYPIYKILKKRCGWRIVIINDMGDMDDWDARYFTFIQQ